MINFPKLPFKEQLRSQIIPRRSPSKLFTRLIKRDSDSVLSFSPKTYSFSVEDDSSGKESKEIEKITLETDDCLDYCGSGQSSGSNSDSSDSEYSSSTSSRGGVLSKQNDNSIANSRNQFRENYFLGVEIGSGATSTVYLVTRKKSGERYAAKIIPTKNIFTKYFKTISKEIAIIKKLNHPNIIKLYECFLTLENLYIVMEFVDGDELFDVMLRRRVFSEAKAKVIIRQILDPLAYLHKQNIAHGDLKPENIKFNGAKTSVKLLDFGFARLLVADGAKDKDKDKQEKQEKEKEKENLGSGTLGYEAPEIITNSRKQTCAVDMWALGVIIYTMLCGYTPFVSDEMYHDEDHIDSTPFWAMFNENTLALRNAIKNGQYTFSTYHWRDVSDEAKDFISQLLTVDPEQRMKAEDALKHPWFKSVLDLTSISLSIRE
ncbi:hypothetical protein SAMD00019534_093190, partial [Acytostelium subglobosum LB1]|uniref:hypothetical protein n=1 Tax=Acytostelium subglobosum LB1 TaxID=1410327 RepID=UPI000644947D